MSALPDPGAADLVSLRSFARDAARRVSPPDPMKRATADTGRRAFRVGVSIMEERVEELRIFRKSKRKNKLKETTMHKRERNLKYLLFQQADDSFKHLNVLLRQLCKTVELLRFFLAFDLEFKPQTPPKMAEE